MTCTAELHTDDRVTSSGRAGKRSTRCNGQLPLVCRTMGAGDTSIRPRYCSRQHLSLTVSMHEHRDSMLQSLPGYHRQAGERPGQHAAAGDRDVDVQYYIDESKMHMRELTTRQYLLYILRAASRAQPLARRNRSRSWSLCHAVDSGKDLRIACSLCSCSGVKWPCHALHRCLRCGDMQVCAPGDEKLVGTFMHP